VVGLEALRDEVQAEIDRRTREGRSVTPVVRLLAEIEQRFEEHTLADEGTLLARRQAIAANRGAAPGHSHRGWWV
jgi:hypothetical protein